MEEQRSMLLHESNVSHNGSTSPSAHPYLTKIRELNERYHNRPVNKVTAERTEDGFRRRAESRLALIPSHLSLTGKRVLEIGCGSGHFGDVAAPLVKAYVGVDIEAHENWSTVAASRPNAEFWQGDLTATMPFESGSFDMIVSWVVWEHLEHPRSMLAVAQSLLRPGGYLIFKANVFTSAIGSHLYRDIYFPWPHLIFPEDALREFVREKWRLEGATSAEQRGEEPYPEPCLYVNCLSFAHYLWFFREQRWRLKRLRKQFRKIDEEFYQEFRHVLGRYPRHDLSLDFFTAVLRKQGGLPAGYESYLVRYWLLRVIRAAWRRVCSSS